MGVGEVAMGPRDAVEPGGAAGSLTTVGAFVPGRDGAACK